MDNSLLVTHKIDNFKLLLKIKLLTLIVNICTVTLLKSAIFNSLFTTGQKINIAVSRCLIDFYSNIRALAMLSRCSLELSMGVLPEA